LDAGGNPATAKLLAHVLAQTGRCVGAAGHGWASINGRNFTPPSSGTAQAVRDVLAHPGVQAGVFALDHETILREGLPIDACDVAVLVRPAQAGSAARRVLIESVAPTGAAVLNAADTNVSEMLCRCPGEAILFSQDAA